MDNETKAMLNALFLLDGMQYLISRKRGLRDTSTSAEIESRINRHAQDVCDFNKAELIELLATYKIDKAIFGALKEALTKNGHNI